MTSFLTVGATEVHILRIRLKGGYGVLVFSLKLSVVVREKSEKEQ